MGLRRNVKHRPETVEAAHSHAAVEIARRACKRSDDTMAENGEKCGDKKCRDMKRACRIPNYRQMKGTHAAVPVKDR